MGGSRALEPAKPLAPSPIPADLGHDLLGWGRVEPAMAWPPVRIGAYLVEFSAPIAIVAVVVAWVWAWVRSRVGVAQ